MALSVLVPLHTILNGGLAAVRSVAQRQRSVMDVLRSCVRAMAGPWWGVVPLDTWFIRRAVLRASQ